MVTLVKGYKYDNRYDYIKTFSSKTAQNSYFSSLPKIVIDDDNYIKDYEGFLVNYEYDFLVNEGVNYLIFNNGEKDIYAFITRKEYVNEEVTRLNFEIDVIQTYLFDFTIDKSFVERKVCSIDEITDYDEGIDIGEHVIESDNIVLNKNHTYFAMFSGFKDYFVPKEGTDYKEFPLIDAKRPVTIINGVTYPLLFVALTSDFLPIFQENLLDNPNLVGIIRFPNCSYTTTNFFLPRIKLVGDTIVKTGIGITNAVTSITSETVTGSSVGVPKGTITDFYPYTYYVLSDGESEPLLMQPQYCGGSITVTGKFALSNSPVERYYPSYYKGSTNGNIYNITTSSVCMLPIGGNGGMETIQANASQIEQSKKSALTTLTVNSAIAGGMAGMSLATGNAMGVATAVGSAVSSYVSVMNQLARKKDLELTPSTIKSFGNIDTRESFGTNNVRVIKYTIQDKYKSRVNNFIERYGNKYNNFATIDIKSYKGYLKMSGPNIDSTIDNLFINKIIEILERGVFVE